MIFEMRTLLATLIVAIGGAATQTIVALSDAHGVGMWAVYLCGLLLACALGAATMPPARRSARPTHKQHLAR
jgi:hypothetical protein